MGLVGREHDFPTLGRSIFAWICVFGLKLKGQNTLPTKSIPSRRVGLLGFSTFLTNNFFNFSESYTIRIPTWGILDLFKLLFHSAKYVNLKQNKIKTCF